MANLYLKQINFSQLSRTPIIDGQIVCCLDNGDLYRDTSIGRIKLCSDIISVSEKPLAFISGKIYYLTTNQKFYDSNWNSLTLETIVRNDTSNISSSDYGDIISFIDNITTDSYGRVTNVNTTSLTLPENKIIAQNTSYWNTNCNTVGTKGDIFIFMDYFTTSDNKLVPGIKIADGITTVENLPFTDTKLSEHLLNNTIHITQNERIKWNSKMNCYVNENLETLIFNTD